MRADDNATPSLRANVSGNKLRCEGVVAIGKVVTQQLEDDPDARRVRPELGVQKFHAVWAFLHNNNSNILSHTSLVQCQIQTLRKMKGAQSESHRRGPERKLLPFAKTTASTLLSVRVN